MFKIDYCETEAGERPAETFISSLDRRMKAKVVSRIALLEEYGPSLAGSYSRHLEDGIFELRISQGNDAVRVMYFFVSGQRAILTHGFVKKTQKTPRSQIKRAKRLRAYWRRKNER